MLRLTRTAGTTEALLAAGTGRSVSLLAAWSAGSTRHWTLSPEFRLNAPALTATSFGPAGTAAIMLNGNRGVIITSTATTWRALPELPAGTATLALGPAGGIDALAVHRTRLTIWQLTQGSTAWTATQVITVPIQFGSSG